MATITIGQELYDNVKCYADEKKVSVEEYVVSIITSVIPKRNTKKKTKYKMKKVEELSPLLQNILNMPRTGQIDGNDINGTIAREEYYKEKDSLQ